MFCVDNYLLVVQHALIDILLGQTGSILGREFSNRPLQSSAGTLASFFHSEMVPVLNCCTSPNRTCCS